MIATVPFLTGVLTGFIGCFFLFCTLAAVWKARAGKDDYL